MNPHLDELISLCKHPAIQGRRGEWRLGDRWTYGNEIGVVIPDRTGELIIPANNATWIPYLSDPIQPERGLMLMCPITAWLVPIYTLGQPPICWECQWVTEDGETIVVGGPTPEIAVCKAIIAQYEEGK